MFGGPSHVLIRVTGMDKVAQAQTMECKKERTREHSHSINIYVMDEEGALNETGGKKQDIYQRPRERQFQE